MAAVEIKVEELHEWLLSPVTKQLKARFAEDLQRLKDAWAEGQFGSDPLLDAKARGQCEVISQFLALEKEDLDQEA